MDGSDGKYISSAHIRGTFGVSNSTLRKWADSGRLTVVRSGPGGKRYYKQDDVEKLFEGYRPKTDDAKEAAAERGKRVGICYARVSSGKQKDDLERQVAGLKEKYPTYEVVTDVASGINWKRRGLLSVLDRAMSGGVSELVVAHRDRLCRFAFDLLEHVFRRAGCRVVVLYKSDAGTGGDGDGPDAELRDDLLAIVTVFVASNNGKRAAAHRRANRERAAAAADEAGEASADESSEGEEEQGGGGAGPERKRGRFDDGDEVQEAADLPVH